MEEYNICSPQPPAFQAVHNYVGPMGNIDPPPELLLRAKEFQLSLLKNNSALTSTLAAIGIYLCTQLHAFTSSLIFFLWVDEWVHGQREAVSFEGDFQPMTLMSYSLQTQAPLQERIKSLSLGIYLFLCYALVSLALSSLGSLLTKSPLNRSMLVLRGICATVCLSSATTSPFVGDFGLRYLPASRSFIGSCLFASEASWIIYIRHMGHIFIMEYSFGTRYNISCMSYSNNRRKFQLDNNKELHNFNHIILPHSNWNMHGLFYEKYKPTTVIHRVLPAAGIAFLNESRGVGFTSSTIDIVSAGMCGIFRFNNVLFDRYHFQINTMDSNSFQLPYSGTKFL
ncbi:hypothetical protein THRCLA_09380 [Thraustotheca clavata]|uniref:Transmembrane protein n=1 Tax=Thraustotheca clavata TaxID=74557 RepID=A0A1V9YWW2_9STRA|nr:hypothetical protein THRCLA_09380 [Thraustotheca clavata]